MFLNSTADITVVLEVFSELYFFTLNEHYILTSVQLITQVCNVLLQAASDTLILRQIIMQTVCMLNFGLPQKF